jgi:hypothetical protein
VADGYIARMMLKPNGGRLTPGAAPLLFCRAVGLLVRHVSDHANEVDGTIALASRGIDALATVATHQSCRAAGSAIWRAWNRS